MRECEGYGLGKMRQKNVSKEQVPRTKSIGESMFIDISSFKHKSTGGAKFWALFMDDCSGSLINWFLREKSDLARQGSMLIKKLNDQHGIKIKVIRCDNVGENKKIKKLVTGWDSEQDLSTKQLELRNRMVELKENLPPYMEE